MRYTEKRNGKNVIPLRNAVCGMELPHCSIDKQSDIQSFLSGDAVDRLAELEDKIEKGTLMELPFMIKCSTKYAVVVARSGRGRRLYKTVTMPIDEAEAILKVMKKKGKSDE